MTGDTWYHGPFGGRLSQNVTSTTEWLGFSMWHLTAAKILDNVSQEQFLISACGASSNTLIDDLREGMAVFSDIYETSYRTNGCHRLNGIREWGELKLLTAFKSPLEICATLNVPLILWQDSHEFEGTLHPVIAAAQLKSCELIGWPMDEIF